MNYDHDEDDSGSRSYGSGKKGPCFKAPPGADLEGEDGEAMVNWTRRADGLIEITAVNGVSLGGPERPPRPTNEPGAESGIDDLEGVT